MTPDEFLDIEGYFIWLWGAPFFIETAVGNFIWLSPEYPEGDNSIRYTSKTYKEYMEETKPKNALIYYGRNKGEHVIGDYCGRDVIFTRATIGKLSAL